MGEVFLQGLRHYLMMFLAFELVEAGDTLIDLKDVYISQRKVRHRRD